MGDLSIEGSIFGSSAMTSTSVNESAASRFTSSLTDLMLACVAKGSSSVGRPAVSFSSYADPIAETANRLVGTSRNWGGASTETQMKVMDLILNRSRSYSIDDRAVLLGTAYIESGFNPDAASKTSSASGLFQFIKDTGKSFGLNTTNRFDAATNLDAGLKLFNENSARIDRKYSTLTGDARSVMLYALHHDGPSLKYGGADIAKEKLLPILPKFWALVEAWDASQR